MRTRPYPVLIGRSRRLTLVGILFAVVISCTTAAAPSIANRSATTAEVGTAPGGPRSVPGAPESARDGASNVSPIATAATQPTAPAGVVVRTVFPGYNATLPGAFVSSVADWQVGGPAYIPEDSSIWFPQSIAAVPGTPLPNFAPTAMYDVATGKFAGFQTALSNLSALAYDPQNGLVYGTNTSADSVVAFNVTTGVEVGSPIPVGASPRALVFDPPTHSLFVANSGSGNLTVVNTQDNEVWIGNVPVGNDPIGIADDSKDGIIFVANGASSFLSYVLASDPAEPQSSIPLFDGPATAISYAAGSDRVLAVSPGSKYATLLQASTATVLNALIPVGTGFGSIIPSSNDSEFVTGNGTGPNVAVINATNGSVVSHAVDVGRNVTRLVTDPLSGLPLAWTSSERELVGLNLTSNTAAPASDSALPEVSSASFDPAASRVLLAADNQTGILGASDESSNGVVSEVGTEYSADSVAVDTENLRTYVGTSNDIEVLNASTGQELVAATGVSGQSRELVVDAADNLLWFMNSISGVSALNLSSNTLAFSTGLLTPADSTTGLALDTAGGELFVLVTSSSLAVVSARTGHTIVSSIDVGTNVTSLAYDPFDNEVYAAGNSLTLLNATTLEIDAGPITLGSAHRVTAAAYDPTRRDVYVATVGSAPSDDGILLAIDGRSVNASEGSVVEIPVGEGPSALAIIPGGNGSAPGSGIVWVTNELSGTVSVIASPPSILSFAAYSDDIDLGQSTAIQVSYVGGAGTSSLGFGGIPTGNCSPPAASMNCTPTEVGSFHLTVVVTDSFGETAAAAANLTVVSAPSVSMAVTPSTLPLVDVGVPVNATATADFGIPPYHFSWSFGDGAIATGPNSSHEYSEPGSYSLMVVATDSTGASNYSSRAVTVVYGPAVRVVALAGNRTDVNVPLQFSGSVQGGVGLQRQWWLFGDADSANGQNVSHAWEQPGNFTLRYSYLDLLGEGATATMEVHINPSLSATFASTDGENSSPVDPGQAVYLTSKLSGGTAPYSVTWSFGDGSFATGASLTHAYAAAGTYLVNVSVTDAVGEVVKGNLTIFVSAAPTGGGGITSLGGQFASGVFLGILLGVVAAAVVLVVLGSRRGKKRAARPVSPYVPP